MVWTLRISGHVLIGLLAFSASSWGQEESVDRSVTQPTEQETEGTSLLRDIGSDLSHFFTARESYVILGVGLGSSAVLHPLDDRIIESRLNGERFQGSGLDLAFETGEVLGGAMVQFGGALATYGIGKVSGQSEVAELGRDLLRAQLLSSGVTQLLKYTVRRTRPDGSSRASFPSGHASGTFASAAVLHRRYGLKVGAPAMAVASYVAASRMSENKHHLSDLVFGAAIGLAAGRVVTIDRGSTRFELTPMAVHGGGGIQVTALKRR